jgi:hypothetical protein
MRAKPSISAYLIRVRELAPAWLSLYAVSLWIQAFCAPLRAAVSYGLLWLILTVLGKSTSWLHLIAWMIGYGPLVFSVATLLLPLGSWLWQQQSGGGHHQNESA